MKTIIYPILLILTAVFSLNAYTQSYPELIKLSRAATEENYLETETKFNKTVKKHQKDPYVYCERYFLYRKFHKDDLALNDISKAIELMPSKYIFYESRIDLLLEMDKTTEAWKDINTIYAMDATIPDAHYYRGYYFLMLDSLQLALKHYNKAVSIYESNHAPCSIMSKCYRSRGRLNFALGYLNEAIHDFTKSLAKVRENKIDNLLMHRAKAFISINDTKNGWQDIGAAFASKPDTMTLAYLYALKGNSEEVNTLASFIVAHHTNSLHEHRSNVYNVACMYAILNNKTKALEYLEKSLQLGFNKFNWIQVDYDMKNIKELPEFITLINKYRK